MSDDTFSLTVLDEMIEMATSVRIDVAGPCKTVVHPDGYVTLEDKYGRSLLYMSPEAAESLFGLTGEARSDDLDGGGMSGPVGGDRGSEGV